MITIIFIIFTALLLTFGLAIGYLLAPRIKQPETDNMQIKQLKSEVDKLYRLMIGEEPKAPQHTIEEDLGLINSEGVGIVYRPTQEEIAKMNEPREIKEAKEAIAETLRQEQAPEL